MYIMFSPLSRQEKMQLYQYFLPNVQAFYPCCMKLLIHLITTVVIKDIWGVFSLHVATWLLVNKLTEGFPNIATPTFIR